MAAGGMVRFEQKKRKLLFSFVTNTVKMCGFVESAQRKRVRAAGITTGSVRFDMGSTGETGQYNGI
jgi:hypothetical protein